MSHASHDHHQIKNLKIAFALNLGFTLLEILGGLATNSIAILSDALHDLGDSLSLGIAWYLEKVSRRGRSRGYSFGYERFSLLGALINTIILIAGSLFVLSEAVPRLLQPEHSNAAGMTLFAVIGIAVNGFAALRLRGGKTLNTQVVAWHLLEDVLGWIAVLIVGITLFFTDIHILDPILSILITLYILYNVIGKFRKTLNVFLLGTPEDVNIEEIERRIVAIEGVQSTHHPHLWSLDGESHVLTMHLVIDEDAGKEDIIRIKQACKLAVEDMQFSHLTLEIEYENEACKFRIEA
jgi:cobalt-zinc-cadmium efflux system protein